MLSYSIRNEFADGQSVEFVPTAVQPLGLNELATLARQPDASITIQWLADDPKINGDMVPGIARMSHRITFNEAMAIYALVPNGGWLPVPFVSPACFLLDRNVVANFRKLRLNQNFRDQDALRLWTAFFDQGAGVFNPLPYAFEGSLRRVQTFEEFVREFERGVQEIEDTFPRCTIVRYSATQYRAAFEQFVAIHAKTPLEMAFLCEISPVLTEPTSDAKLRTAVEQILATADRFNVARQSLAVLLALSSLYEDPRFGSSIGRQILKPKHTYGPPNAYNAISDLRHIELAALGHAWATNAQFALCTCDRAIASLWCALAIRDVIETATGPEFTIDYSSDLFPRLTDVAALSEIASLLSSDCVPKSHP